MFLQLRLKGQLCNVGAFQRSALLGDALKSAIWRQLAQAAQRRNFLEYLKCLGAL
jgi:hypothetical protein